VLLHGIGGPGSGAAKPGKPSSKAVNCIGSTIFWPKVLRGAFGNAPGSGRLNAAVAVILRVGEGAMLNIVSSVAWVRVDP